MNPRIKKKWLKALRSGCYQQGQGQLCVSNTNEPDVDRFCCLGVLCDLHAEEQEDGWEDGSSHQEFCDLTYLGSTGRLPSKILKWAGLAERNPVVTNQKGVYSNLANENDTGRSFVEIADLIEKQL